MHNIISFGEMYFLVMENAPFGIKMVDLRVTFIQAKTGSKKKLLSYHVVFATIRMFKLFLLRCK